MTRYYIQFDAQGCFKVPKNKVYTVNKNDNVTFVLDSQKLKNLKPILLTNVPKKNQKNQLAQPKAPAIKQNFVLESQSLQKNYTYFEGTYNRELSWLCDVNVGEFGGSIQVQIIFVDFDADVKKNLDVKYVGNVEWVLVEPDLRINGKSIQKNQLVVQTVLPPSLGKADRWPKILKESLLLKYNAFHFPPVQELGRSQSLYSVKDQLKLNPDLFTGGEKQIKEIIGNLEKDGALSFIDILLNHTSADSEWLTECEGAYYNEKNAPHLNSAIILDEALYQFGKKLENKQVQEYPKNTIENGDDLEEVMELIRKYVLNELKLEEFFCIDIEEVKKDFLEGLKKQNIKIAATEYDLDDGDNIFAKSGIDIIEEQVIKFTKNVGAQRFKVKVDIEAVIKAVLPDISKISLEGFARALEFVNKHWQEKSKQYIEDAYNGIKGTIQYEHIDRQMYEINDENPLVKRYFTKLKNGDFAANNGWIMNLQNVQENFVESDQFYYLRRQIVIWCDLIKLRYGDSKKDSKPLWKRMKQYVQSLAQIFHGFRIDNAHSTPLHVGEYFIRKARQANKNLVVFAELFTGNPDEDALFVKRMGLNALVRETIHSCKSDHIIGQLEYLTENTENIMGALPPLYEFDIEKGEKLEVLVPRIPSTLIYDQTHDNEALIRKQGMPQMMSLMSLLTFSNIFCGTVKGYDELYTEQLSVVNEKRLYGSQGEPQRIKVEKEDYNVGIVYRPKQPLNDDQKVFLFGSFNQWKEGIPCVKEGDVYIARFKVNQIGTFFYKFTVDSYWILDEHKQEQEGNHYFTLTVNKNKVQYENLAPVRQTVNTIIKEIGDDFPETKIQNHGWGVVSVVREHKSKNQSYMLITRTAYNDEFDSDFVNFQIQCSGQLDVVKNIFVPSSKKPNKRRLSTDNTLSGYSAKIYEEYNIREFADLFYSPETNKQILHFYNMRPGTIIILKCSLAHTEKEQIQNLNKAVGQSISADTDKLYSKLSPLDLNYMLYICEQEQWERNGSGSYQVPNKGGLTYSGIAGLFHDINEGSRNRNIKLPIANNIRDGNWLVDYISNRLYQGGESLKPVADHVSQIFSNLKTIPAHLKPFYFYLIIKLIQEQVTTKVYSNLKYNRDKFKSTFCRNLLLSCYQFIGESPSSKFEPYTFSISAGLPHFSTGWARAWGRDTFIAFRGLLLLTGLYEQAKQIILMFASTLRHGLIPNLLDGGRNSRYNNRDSCWWFIKAIKDYIEVTQDTSIWNQKINMVFLDDSIEIHYIRKNEGQKVEKALHEIVQEIFEKHANGIKFREWRAGNDIDSNMTNEGFNISLQLDHHTGFIIGGNPHNCLTWMDKMGSSQKSGNKGVPATSRNGAPIELTALLKLSLDFVHKQNLGGNYPYTGVKINDTTLQFSEWSKKIEQNFEKQYWIPENPESQYDQKNAYISGIYKDLVFCSDIKKNYQLRPNACIAIAVAPELFTPANAISHLNKSEKYLLEENSLGIKTLDILSDNYVSYYDNDDDSTYYETSHGFSYHNGPEWVWVYAYFLQALLKIRKLQPGYRSQSVMSHLAQHKHHLQHSEWQSLPEMTNQNGEYCKFSCPAQAWSIGCILEVAIDLQE